MPATVYFDRDCGICQFSQRWTSRFDWISALRWVPFQQAGDIGISPEALEERMHLLTPTRKAYTGFAAWKQIFLRLPVFWLLIAATLLLSRWFAFGWLLFFSPLFSPVGEAAYDWVARNRYRLPGSTCKVKL